MSAASEFLGLTPIAVAGASTDRSKYGNIVLRTLMEKGFDAIPVNPSASVVEGRDAFVDLASVTPSPLAVSIVTPPAVTRKIVQQAIDIGVKAIWMQPGAEDEEASQMARDAGIHLIDDGSCILVELASMRR